jgi:uncharacterized membrane protein
MSILALASQIGGGLHGGGHPFLRLVFGLFFGLLLPVAIVGLLIYAGWMLFRGERPAGFPGAGRPWAPLAGPPPPGPAEHVLELRLAQGEITAEEYLERLGALRRGRAQWVPAAPAGPAGWEAASPPPPAAPTAPLATVPPGPPPASDPPAVP